MRCLRENVRRLLVLVWALSSLSYAQGTASVAELNAILNQATSLDHFFSQPDLVKAYEAKLKSYQHRDKYRCESFETIVKKVKTLRTKIPGFYQRLWEVVPGETIHARVFEEATPQEPPRFTTYTFRPAGRRFNGIFNDPSTNGCISDECVKNDPSSPDRWGIALAQSQLYYVEKNGMFADLSLLVTPISRRQERFGLVTLGGGPQLSRTLGIEDPITKKRIETSLLNVWLSQQLEKKFPFHSFVKLERNAEWGKNITRASPAQLPLSHVVGEPGEFVPTDTLAKRIETHAGRRCLAWKDSESVKGTGLGLGRDLLYGSLGEKDALLEYSVLGLPIADPSNYASVAQALKEVDGKGVGPLGQVKPADQQKLQLTLKNIFEQDKDAEKRARALMALDLLNDRGATTKPPAQRSQAAASSAKEAPSFLKDTFTKALADANPDVRRAGALGLANLNPASLKSPRIGDVVGQLAQTPLDLSKPAGSAGNGPSSSGGSRGTGNRIPASESTPDGGQTPKTSVPDAQQQRGRDTAIDRGVPLSARRLSDIVDRMATGTDPRRVERDAERMANYLRKTPELGSAFDAIYGGDENDHRHEFHDQIGRELEEQASNPEDCSRDEKNKKERTLFQKLETVSKQLRNFCALEQTAYANHAATEPELESSRDAKTHVACGEVPEGYLKPEQNGALKPYRAYLVKSESSTREDDEACTWIFTDECGGLMGSIRAPSLLHGRFLMETPNDFVFGLTHKGDTKWIPVRCGVTPSDDASLRLTQPNGTPISIHLEDLREQAAKPIGEQCRAMKAADAPTSKLVERTQARDAADAARELGEEKKAEAKAPETAKQSAAKAVKKEEPTASAPRPSSAAEATGPVECKNHLGNLKPLLTCDCADFDLAYSCYVGLALPPMPGTSQAQKTDACLARYETACSSCTSFQKQDSKCGTHLYGYKKEDLTQIGFEYVGSVPGHGAKSEVNLVAVPPSTTPEAIMALIAQENERLHRLLTENPREARRSKASEGGPNKCGQLFQGCLNELKATRQPTKN